ncbi:unnamed protein product, partial [Ixodes hexagonus]
MDSARSWAVAVACCWINVFGFAIVRSAGVVYVGILETFCVTREQAAWPVNLASVCYMTAGPLAGFLARYIAIWKLTLSGCVIGSLAVSACFWARSLTFLNASLGVIHGTSVGFLVLFAVVINQHFRKYRAMASGISHAGFSIGAIVFSPLIQVLFGEYGLRGSLLLSGALMLNSTAGVFLQRPPPVEGSKPVGRRHQLVQNDKSKASKRENDSLPDSTVKCRRQETGKESAADIEADVNENQDDNIIPSATETLLSNDVNETVRHTRKDGKSETSHQHSQESDFLKQQAEAPLDHASSIIKNHDQSSGTSVFSFVTFPRFYLIAGSQALVFFIMGTYITVVVDFSVDMGISRWHGVSLVSLYNVADMVARIGSGWVTDRGCLRKSTMMTLHFALWTLSLFVIPFCSAYYSQVLLSAVGGWCNGCVMILIVVFLVELVGIDNLGVTFGVCIFISGACGLLRPSLIG